MEMFVCWLDDSVVQLQCIVQVTCLLGFLSLLHTSILCLLAIYYLEQSLCFYACILVSAVVSGHSFVPGLYKEDS